MPAEIDCTRSSTNRRRAWNAFGVSPSTSSIRFRSVRSQASVVSASCACSRLCDRSASTDASSRRRFSVWFLRSAR